MLRVCMSVSNIHRRCTIQNRTTHLRTEKNKENRRKEKISYVNLMKIQIQKNILKQIEY